MYLTQILTSDDRERWIFHSFSGFQAGILYKTAESVQFKTESKKRTFLSKDMSFFALFALLKSHHQNKDSQSTGKQYGSGNERTDQDQQRKGNYQRKRRRFPQPSGVRCPAHVLYGLEREI